MADEQRPAWFKWSQAWFAPEHYALEHPTVPGAWEVHEYKNSKVQRAEMEWLLRWAKPMNGWNGF